MANNNKADLFISLHANASFRKTTGGASIYYAAFDGAAALAARASPASNAADIQRRRCATSSSCCGTWRRSATSISRWPSPRSWRSTSAIASRWPCARSIARRSRVLESANMPAVLVEMGFLTNAEQEKQLAGARIPERARAGGLPRRSSSSGTRWLEAARNDVATQPLLGAAAASSSRCSACAVVRRGAARGTGAPPRRRRQPAPPAAPAATRPDDQGAAVLRLRRRHAADGCRARRAVCRGQSSRRGEIIERADRADRSSRSCSARAAGHDAARAVHDGARRRLRRPQPRSR